MKKKDCIVCVAILFLFAGLITFSVGKGFKLLNEDQIAKLKPDAIEAYKQAAVAIDKIQYDQALEKLKEAHKADPDHVELAFLLADAAIYRALSDRGQKSIDCFKIAKEALDTILDKERHPVLKRLDKRRAEKMKLKILSEDEVIARDRKRDTAGKKFVKEYLEETATPTPAPPSNKKEQIEGMMLIGG